MPIDSLRVPVPLDIHSRGKPQIDHLAGARECSLFGEWQKPLTLQYTSILYHNLELPICSGGGFTTGADVIEAIMLGATTVQFATAIIKFGFEYIKKLLDHISEFMERHNYKAIEEIRGLAHEHIDWNGHEVFRVARARINHDLCIECGACTSTVWCSSINLNAMGKIQITDTCDNTFAN